MDARQVSTAPLLLLALAGAVAAPLVFAEEEGAFQAALAYTAESWRVASGGAQTGNRYLGNLDVSIQVDGERAFGVPLSVHAHVMHNNGGDVGALAGDAQGVSGIEAPGEAWWLFELWADWRFGSRAGHSLRYGVYDVNSEFDVTPTAGLFTGASHGMGSDFAQTGELGPSTFPLTGLAGRYRWQINPRWSAQFAVADGVPGDPERPRRVKLRLSSDEGALLISEVARESGDAKLALGLWHYTARFEPLLAADESRHLRSNRGAYALFDVPLRADASSGSAAPPASAFVRVGVANGDLNRFTHYAGAGVVFRGLARADRADELGFAVAYAHNGSAYRRLMSQLDRPAERAETQLELTWRTPVSEWLSVQPTLKYIVNPDTDPTRRNAWILGMRVELAAGHTC